MNNYGDDDPYDMIFFVNLILFDYFNLFVNIGKLLLIKLNRIFSKKKELFFKSLDRDYQAVFKIEINL